MKMKSINVMLTICLAATISACGSNGSAPQEVTPVEETEETTAETVGESEEPPVYEEVSYEVVIMEANEETGIWKACDANGQEYDVTAAVNLPDEELALLVPGGGVKISTELLSDEESSEIRKKTGRPKRMPRPVRDEKIRLDFPIRSERYGRSVPSCTRGSPAFYPAPDTGREFPGVWLPAFPVPGRWSRRSRRCAPSPAAPR